MYPNRPFNSTNINLYDEFLQSTAPSILNGHNVLILQEQQRQISDTVKTSITDNPFNQLAGNLSDANNEFQRSIIGWLQARKQFCPGGVVKFRFGQSRSTVPELVRSIDPPQSSYTSGNILTNDFFPSSVINPQLPELKLHYNVSTSCTDLLPSTSQIQSSKACADFQSICGSVVYAGNQKFYNRLKFFSGFFPAPSVEFSSNAKKLRLSKPPDYSNLNKHVIDLLNNANGNKKTVSFLDQSTRTEDKSLQTSLECICQNKKHKKRKKKKREMQHEYSSTSSSSEEDDNNDKSTDKYKGKSKRKNEKQYERNSETDTSDSVNEKDLSSISSN